MPKTNPEHEAYVERAQAARSEQAERLAENPPRRGEDFGVLRAKIEKRRAQIEASAARGDLMRWAVGQVAECFSDGELPRLLELNAEGHEEKRRRAERRQEAEAVAGLARTIEREREAEAKASADREARERLGVD